MVLSCGDAPAVLEPVDEALNPVSGRIQGAVDRLLVMLVFLGGDLGRATPSADFISDGVAVVSPVGQHSVGVSVVLGHKINEGRAVVDLSRRQQERDWKILSVGPGMGFGREATARAAKRLVLSPPFAPAAQ